MTAQIEEIILLDGKQQGFGGLKLPLEPVLKARKITHQGLMSCLWRGYVGYWALRDGCLFLERFEGGEDRDGRVLRLDDIFPGRALPIFAEWFTGEFTVFSGELLRYAHVGWASRFENERTLGFKEGRLLTDVTKRNTLESVKAEAEARREYLERLRAGRRQDETGG
jgi:hypothetical protein